MNVIGEKELKQRLENLRKNIKYIMVISLIVEELKQIELRGNLV